LKVAAFWWASNHQQQFANLSWVDVSRDYHQEALAAAKKADVIVFCGGISSNLEGEEMKIETDGFAHGDRTHINLPKIQEDLLKELKLTGKPIVYVNFSGSAVALNWENETLPAIVQAFYPGESAGTALTRLLFGDFNPSGRLPVTFYKSIDQLPDFKNYDMAGRTYRYFKDEPLYPFGYGLSYTNFTYSNSVVSGTAKTGDEVCVTVDVRNTGKIDGDEVVQLYVSNKTSANAPIKSLKGIRRITLKAGEQKTVSFTLKPVDFSIINSDAKEVVEPGTYEISVGGVSSGKNNMVKTIQLVGSVIEIKLPD
jgi:beta-glucosidase